MKRDKENGGQGLVEFALLLPVFLLLLFGMVEFGRAYMTKNILTGAAREGVRRAVVQVDFTTAKSAGEARAYEVLNSAGLYTPAVVAIVANDNTDPKLLVCTVTYNFPIIVGGFFGFTGPGNVISLKSETSMRRELY